jgi:hypothetical protein
MKLEEPFCEGDIIKCININRATGITIDGLYEVLGNDIHGSPFIITDSNRRVPYKRNRFVFVENTLTKLEKLGL